MEAKSPAKINLFLNVIGRREDGYHLLESIFAPISLCDTIKISPSDTISCNTSIGFIENNLATRAAILLKEKYNVATGCKIEITKNIPLGGGLGGGSSNAGTTLKLLSQFWNLNLTDAELRQLAIMLGTDVPFFIKPTPAFVSGIGEKIKPIKLGITLPLLIVNPNIHVDTKSVFSAGFSSYTDAIDQSNIEEEVWTGKNDTYSNSTKISPQIIDVIDWLNSQKELKFARMSGTGSTCFGVFSNIKAAEEANNKAPKNWLSYIELLSL
jgi:4-diphosphocytidyl-2-C-methyl-D-erythritol kinase